MTPSPSSSRTDSPSSVNSSSSASLSPFKFLTSPRRTSSATRPSRSSSISSLALVARPPTPCSTDAFPPPPFPARSLLRRKKSSPSVSSVAPLLPPLPHSHSAPSFDLQPKLDPKGRPVRQRPSVQTDPDLLPPPTPKPQRDTFDDPMTSSASNHMMKNSKRGRPFVKVRPAQSFPLSFICPPVLCSPSAPLESCD